MVDSSSSVVVTKSKSELSKCQKVAYMQVLVISVVK